MSIGVKRSETWPQSNLFKTMKKIPNLFSVLLILGLLFFGTTKLTSKTKNEAAVLSKKAIKVDGGFGYQIFSGEKLLVQQEFMPSVQGKVPFRSAKDALKVATLVMDKINAGTQPIIKKEDLTQLNLFKLD